MVGHIPRIWTKTGFCFQMPFSTTNRLSSCDTAEFGLLLIQFTSPICVETAFGADTPVTRITVRRLAHGIGLCVESAQSNPFRNSRCISERAIDHHSRR